MAVSEELRVNLRFNADTTNAKQNINDLGSLLKKITQETNIGFSGSSLDKAVTSARQLEMALASAVNVDTGKLNISKLQSSLKTMGTDVNKVSSQLLSLGSDGQQSFLRLAQSISAAETPMINLNERLRKFGTTLVNTIKWKVATTLINGVHRTLNQAVTHAEELNGALNDIRIVTGYSTNSMAAFAREASKAADALNTSTTEYAKAALIFYQQGLSGDAVAERTEAVIRLSQVTKESVGVASNQLTAIWNNFYDGTKALEYYADAITALGAATASSSSEIATGLEKFASIADTVGLSYEYATAALATVVAETRQSADVVGTAFRTILSRLEGLKLGETLDDGTSLNKYSQALATVGVQIKDTNGELRDADDILDDLGAKWQLLGRDQQVALAQTVGGTRQYAQVIAMMENWQEVQENVLIARNSTGTLQKQADIWADSWEAASKRVQKAREDLGEKFLDDSGIVAIENIFADLTKSVGNFIDAFGGVVPMVLTLGAAFSNQLVPIMRNSFQRMHENIKVFTGAAQREIELTQNKMIANLADMVNSGELSPELAKQAQLIQELTIKKQQLTIATQNMTNAEKAEAMGKFSLYERLNLEIQKRQEVLDTLNRQNSLSKQKIGRQLKRVTANEAIELPENVQDLADAKKQRDVLLSYSEDAIKAQADIANEAEKVVNEQPLGSDWDKKFELYRQEQEKLEAMKAAAHDLSEEEQKRLDILQEYIRQQDVIDPYNNKHQKPEEKSVGIVNSQSGVVDKSTPEYAQQQAKIFQQATDGMQVTGQEGQYHVTLDNITKLIDVQTRYNKIASTTQTTQEKLVGAFQKYWQAIKNVNGDINKAQQATENYQEEIENLLGPLKQLGNQLGGEIFKKIQQFEDSLKKIGNDITPDSFNDIFQGFISDIEETSGGLIELKDQMIQVMAQKMPDDQFINFINRLQEAKQLTEEQADRLIQLRSIGESLKLDQPISRTTQVMTELASTAGRVAMGLNAIKSVANIWTSDDATLFEKISTTLMSLSMIIPLITGVTTTFQAVQRQVLLTEAHSLILKKATQSQEFKNIATKLGLTTAELAEAAAVEANTGARKANLVVKIMEKAVDTFGWAGVAVGIGLIAAATTGIIIYTQALKNKTKATIAHNEEMAKGASETADEAKAYDETSHKLETLTEKYHEVTVASSEYSDVVNEILDTTPDLIEQIEQLRDGLGLNADNAAKYEKLLQKLKDAKLAGNVDVIESTAAEIREILAPATADAIRTGLKGAKDNLWIAVDDGAESEIYYRRNGEVMTNGERAAGTTGTVIGTGIRWLFDGLWKGENLGTNLKDALIDEYNNTEKLAYADISGQSKDVTDALMNQIDILGGLSEGAILKREDDTLQFRLTEDDILKYYQAAQKVKEQIDAGTITAVGNLDDFDQFFETIAGKAKTILDLQSKQANSTIEAYLVENKKTTASIKTYDEFLALRNELLNQGITDDQFKAWSSSNENLKNFASLTAKIELAIDDKPNGEQLKNQLLKYYNNLSEEDKKLFVEIDFNRAMTDEAWNLEMAYLRAKAQEDQVNLNITGLTSVRSKLKDGVSWDEIKSIEGIDWGANDEYYNELVNRVQTQGIAAGQSYLDELLSVALQHQSELLTTMDESNKQLAEHYDNLAKSSTTTSDITKYSQARDAVLARGNEARVTAESASTEQMATRYGLDTDTLRQTTSYIQNNANTLSDLNDELAENKALSQETAKELLRYDKALEAVQKNYEQWETALSSGAIQDQAAAVEELRDVYANLLDVDSSTLSDEFLTDAENLQLLKETAEGSEEAYNQLLEATREDIEMQYHFEGDDIVDLISEQEETLKASGLDEITIGTTLDDTEFINSLNRMIAETGMGAQAIQDYLGSLGYNAEFDPNTTTTTETTTYTVVKPEPIIRTATSSNPALGIDEDVTLVGQGYTSEPYPVTTTRETNAPTLKIKSLTKTSGGEYKYKNSTHGAGSSGAAKKSSGGGGGGGGGSSSRKEPKQSNKEIERYHVIKQTLNSLKKEYDAISKAKDRAFGKQKLDLMDKEIALTKQMAKAQEQYLKEVRDNYAKDRGQIEAYGAIIDENGVITNYDAIMQQQINKYNNAVNSFNSGSLSEDAFKKVEDEYNVFKEYLKQYEDTYSLMIDQEAATQDQLNKLADLKLEKLTYEVELDVKLSDNSIKILDHYLKLLEDKSHAAAEAMGLLGEKYEETEKKLNAAQEGITKLFADKGLGQAAIDAFLAGDTSMLQNGMFTEKEIEQLEEWQDNLINDIETIYDLRKEIQEKFSAELEEYLNDISAEYSKMEKISSILDGLRSLIGLLGKTRLGITSDFMKALNETTMNNITNQISILRAEYDSLAADSEVFRQKMASATSEEDRKFWQEQYDKTQDQMKEITATIISLTQAGAEKAAEIFQSTIQDMFDSLTQELLGYGNISDAVAAFDRYTTLRDERLKDYQKIYELSKLTRQVEKSMSDTQNLKSKSRLRELQEEIYQYQADGAQMTQYELEYLQKKYELRLAEIALEDAQDAKNQVRLVRNADGGWGYVYTADQDAIDQAAQNYEDKLYAMQQFNDETITQTQATILQLMQERQDAMAQLDVNSADYLERAKEINDYYDERLRIHGTTLDEVLKNQSDLYDYDWTNYSAYTNYKISEGDKFLDHWEETWLGQRMPGLYDGAIGLAEAYLNAIGSYDKKGTILGDSYNAYVAYQTQVDNILAVAGLQGFNNFNDTVLPKIKNLGDESNKAAEKAKKLAEALEKDLPKTADAVETWQKRVSNYLATTGKNMEALIKTINTVIIAYAKLSNTTPDTTNLPSGTKSGQYSGTIENSASDTSGSSDPTTGPEGGLPVTKTTNSGGQKATNGSNYHQRVWYFVQQMSRKGSISKVMDSSNYNTAFATFNGIATNSNNAELLAYVELLQRVDMMNGNKVEKTTWYTKHKHTFIRSGGGGSAKPNLNTTMATGGYTGDWAGSEGRYAVLHSKELVLNKKDTKNILESVQLVRAITNKMDTNIGFSRGFKASSLQGTLNGTSIGEQNITIQAEFPNVSSREEIEEALIEIMNYQSQRAATFEY